MGKKSDNTKCWQWCETSRILLHYLRECKMIATLKNNSEVSYKIIPILTIYSTNSPSRYLSLRKKTFVYTQTHTYTHTQNKTKTKTTNPGH